MMARRNKPIYFVASQASQTDAIPMSQRFDVDERLTKRMTQLAEVSGGEPDTPVSQNAQELYMQFVTGRLQTC